MQMIELTKTEVQEVSGASFPPIGVFPNGIGLVAGISELLMGTAYVGSEALTITAHALVSALGGAWGPYTPA